LNLWLYARATQRDLLKKKQHSKRRLPACKSPGFLNNMMPSSVLKISGHVHTASALAGSPAEGRSITGRSIYCFSKRITTRAATEHCKDASIAEAPHIGCSSSQKQYVQATFGQYPQQSGRPQHSRGAQVTTASSSSSSSSDSNTRSTARRQLLLRSSLAPFLVPLVLGSDDATTIVNSVLSAYGEQSSCWIEPVASTIVCAGVEQKQWFSCSIRIQVATQFRPSTAGIVVGQHINCD
jgi:hypothetical protein